MRFAGIYVPPLPEFPKAFHNIGIRIEDEVLVGKRHPVVLSVNAPKEVRVMLLSDGRPILTQFYSTDRGH